MAAAMAAVIVVDAGWFCGNCKGGGHVVAVVVMVIFFLLVGMIFTSSALEELGSTSIQLHSPSPWLPTPSSLSQTAQAD